MLDAPVFLPPDPEYQVPRKFERIGTPLVYLASPYTHSDKAVMERRYQAALKYTADLIRRKVNVFSPIVYTHQIVQYGLPVDYDFWRFSCERWLAVCDSMIVLMLEGWEISKGINTEISIMGAAGRAIEWHTEDGRVLGKEGIKQ